jgi:hypothetical protein
MQRLGNQVSMETDWYNTVKELQRIVIYIQSVPKLHIMDQWQKDNEKTVQKRKKLHCPKRY